MRKTIILMLIATLLVGAILVSCNNEAAGNSSAGEKLAKVIISGNESKDISATAQNASTVDSLYWFYKASKNDTSVYRTGDTEGAWKPVKVNGTTHVTGLAGADLGYFSEGAWKFSFRGYTSSTVTPNLEDTTAVYYATDVAVSVVEGNLTNGKIYVTVNLTGGAGLANAQVFFSGLNWLYSSDSSSANYQPTLEKLHGLSSKIVVSYKASGTDTWTPFAQNIVATVAYVYENEVKKGAKLEFSDNAFFAYGTESTDIRIPSSSSGIAYSFKFEVYVLDVQNYVLVGETTVESAPAYLGGTITFTKANENQPAINDNEAQYSVIVGTVTLPSANANN